MALIKRLSLPRKGWVRAIVLGFVVAALAGSAQFVLAGSGGQQPVRSGQTSTGIKVQAPASGAVPTVPANEKVQHIVDGQGQAPAPVGPIAPATTDQNPGPPVPGPR